MPPTIRRLLTGLHGLLVVAILFSSLPPITVQASPKDIVSVSPVSQEAVPTPVLTPVPAPVIKIPEATDPVDHSIPPVPIPIEDTYGGEPLREVGLNVEPLVEPSPLLAPVAVSVVLDRYLLAQGEQAILTVGARLVGEEPTNDVALKLTLPSHLQIVGDPETTKIWTYSPEALAERVQHILMVEAKPAAVELPAVVEIKVEAATEGYAPSTQQWLMGVTGPSRPDANITQGLSTQTANGAVLQVADLTILLPAAAAPIGAQIQSTNLFTVSAVTAMPTVATPIVTVTATQIAPLATPAPVTETPIAAEPTVAPTVTLTPTTEASVTPTPTVTITATQNLETPVVEATATPTVTIELTTTPAVQIPITATLITETPGVTTTLPATQTLGMTSTVAVTTSAALTTGNAITLTPTPTLETPLAEVTPEATATLEVVATPEPTTEEPVVGTSAVTETEPAQEDIVVHLPSIHQGADDATTLQTGLAPNSAPVDPSATNTNPGVEVGGTITQPVSIIPASVPTTKNNGVTALRLWQLSAQLDVADGSAPIGENGEHPQFATPVLLVMDVADLVAAGVDMRLVTLWTRPDAEHRWTPVPFARFDAKRQSWVARVNHFSDYALGIAPTDSGELLPSMKGFDSDRHTGAVTFNYPIFTPPGLGGLNPNLSLNYSSQTADDVQFAIEPEGIDPESIERKIQASVVGYGWNLGGLNYITSSRDGDDPGSDVNAGLSYSLVLNGQSYDIFENEDEPGTFETNPYSFAAITRTFGVTESIWQIKTTDGMLYEFGGELPDMTWNDNAEPERWSFVEMRSVMSDTTPTFDVASWYLRRVEDTVGNTMEYSYLVQRESIVGSECYPDAYGHAAWEADYEASNQPWYMRATYMTDIVWSGNNGKYGDAKTPKLRVHLDYTERPDYDNAGTGFEIMDGCQTRKTNQRLEGIYVEALKSDNSGDWQRLRSYDLDTIPAPTGTYTTTGADAYLRHQLLTQIHEYGTTTMTVGLFNTQTFTYTKFDQEDGDTENRIYLTSADNGYRGSTAFTYHRDRAVCGIDHGADGCAPSNIRFFVTRTVTADGQGMYYRVDHGYEGSPTVILYGGKMYNVGFVEASNKIYSPTTSLNGPFTEARYEEYLFYQLANGLAHPDARHGRMQEMRVYNRSGSGNKLYARSVYTWTSQIWNGSTFAEDTYLNNQAHWIFMEAKDEWVDGNGTRTTYAYDPAAQGGTQFGNVTAVEEFAHTHPIRDENSDNNGIPWRPDLSLRRRTETTYFPNAGALTDRDAPYLVSLPAKVIVKNGLGACLSEDRTVYADFTDIGGQNRDGDYDVPPESAFVIKTEKVISGCPYDSAVADTRNDNNLLVTSIKRDQYGNETIVSTHKDSVGGRISIYTDYDTFYALFPVRRWNEADEDLVAEASYYGVNGPAADSTFGYWGAMSETCEVNDICIRLGYNQFGQKIYQWERQAQGSGWPTAAAANVVWAYNTPADDDFPGQTTYYVTEWRSPRCEGNFVRHHYDGLGQLVGEQRSYQDYKVTSANCLPGDNPEVTTGHETATFYQYDALGNQIMATMPQLYEHPYSYYDIEPNWDVRTRTTYDPLSRPVYRYAPNDEYTQTHYFGRVTMVNSPGRNGDAMKRLQHQEMGPLGYPFKLNLLSWTGSSWFIESQIQFTYDSVGRMTAIDHDDIENATPDTSTYTYDQAGRMTSMNDIDLGAWTYVYNRYGQLTDQKDARNTHTCLYYDGLARLAGKDYSNSACPASSSGYDETMVYGGVGSAAAGQVTQIGLREPISGTAYYTKTLTYNSLGQVYTETVSYPVAGAYSTGYRYDTYGRMEQIIYPGDGEQVTYGYNGMGLQSVITSSVYSTLVDGVGYDLLGRMSTAHFAESALITQTLYLSQTVYPWESTSNNSNARLKTINIGTSSGLSNTLGLKYGYDSYGNITRIDERYNNGSTVANTFSYDLFNRLAESTYTVPSITQSFAFTDSTQPDIFMGRKYGYDNHPAYAPSQVTRQSDNVQLTFNHDANGNMIQRQFFETTALARTQVLAWDEANRLERITQSGSFTETYWYDANGIRTRKQRTIVPTPTVLNTGYLNPALQAAETSGSGDNNGYQTNPTNAYSDNGSPYAVDTDSGNGTSTSCTSGQKDKHRFHSYNLEFPTGATIRGIQVRLDALVDNTAGSPRLCVQLSWDGGATWTAAKSTVNTLTTTEATYTLGSPTDTWGRTWSLSELSNANFRVRVINIASDTARDFSLDWAAVRVYYNDVPAPAAESLYPFGMYEVENGTPTRYYLFNGQAVALRTGAEPVTYLHRDQVGSVVMTTQNGVAVDSRQYFAYGSKRGGDDYPFEPDYTGQRRDGTGLLYYNARYYDPELAMFISPDSMIPNPMDYFSYNRYLYGRGNPVSNNDPSGHCATNDDGSPNTTGDAGCWQAAKEWLGTFGIGGYATEAEWTKYFASQPGLTEEHLRNGLYAHWSPIYRQIGIYHNEYNPPPTGMTKTLPHPLDSFDAMASSTGEAIGGYVSDVTSVDCSVRDCVAIGLDTAGVVGASLQVASPLCMQFAAGCLKAGQLIGTSATLMGAGWTAVNFFRGKASLEDVVVTGLTTSTSFDPVPSVGLRAAVVQWVWDTFISPFDPWE